VSVDALRWPGLAPEFDALNTANPEQQKAPPAWIKPASEAFVRG